jgi:hypothetical protein
MARRLLVPEEAQPQRLLADPLDLPVEIQQQHPVALQQALVLQKPTRRRREPPPRHMPLTPIHPGTPHRSAAPQQVQRQIRQARPDLRPINANGHLERSRHNELRADGRSHAHDDEGRSGRDASPDQQRAVHPGQLVTLRRLLTAAPGAISPVGSMSLHATRCRDAIACLATTLTRGSPSPGSSRTQPDEYSEPTAETPLPPDSTPFVRAVPPTSGSTRTPTASGFPSSITPNG